MEGRRGKSSEGESVAERKCRGSEGRREGKERGNGSSEGERGWRVSSEWEGQHLKGEGERENVKE